MCLQPVFIQLPPIHASSCLPSRQILTSLVIISHSNALCWCLHRHTGVLYQSYASLNLVKLIIKMIITLKLFRSGRLIHF